jgi:hypothetical protein
MGITKKQIENDYAKLKEMAFSLFEKKDLESCLDIITTSSNIAYHLNFRFQDQEMEDLLSTISRSINCCPAKNVVENRFVFYDYFGFDNRGLTQQYIRALISWDYEFLFIFENTPAQSKSADILFELKNYSKSSILYVDNELSKIEKIRYITNAINEYQPQKAFLHLAPWDVIGICVWNILSHIQRYQINLTDHAFWLGTNCIDYCIEFREYGYNLSKKYRNIPDDKLLMQSYYPIINEKIKFSRFPVETKGKTVIVSGGAYYKVFGGDELFFKLLSKIIQQHPDIIVFFAGDGDRKLFKSLLNKYEISQKVFLLGDRKDIAQVILNCDIYLGTYPIGGGLITQYAAMLGKPIIAFGNLMSNAESLLLSNDDIKISYYSIESFLNELSCLVNDVAYRKKQGELLKNTIIKPEEFNESLKILINTNKVERTIREIDIDINSVFNQYLDTENNFSHRYYPILMKSYRVYKKYDKFFILKNIYFFYKNNRKVFICKFISEINKYIIKRKNNSKFISC